MSAHNKLCRLRGISLSPNAFFNIFTAMFMSMSSLHPGPYLGCSQALGANRKASCPLSNDCRSLYRLYRLIILVGHLWIDSISSSCSWPALGCHHGRIILWAVDCHHNFVWSLSHFPLSWLCHYPRPSYSFDLCLGSCGTLMARASGNPITGSQPFDSWLLLDIRKPTQVPTAFKPWASYFSRVFPGVTDFIVMHGVGP